MKLNVKRTALVGLAFLTIQAVWQLYNTEIPIMLDKMIDDSVAAKNTIVNAIMSIDNILALFLLPLFGVLSDKTHTRIGKRMPYIIVGTIAASAFLIVLPLCYVLDSFVMFFVVLGGLLLAMSLYRSPAVALMPDVTPKPLRSKANALINLMGAAGTITVLIATFIVGKLTASFADETGDNKIFYIVIFVFSAVFILAAIAVMYFTVDENKLLSFMPADEEETEEERLIREGSGKHIHSSIKTSLIFLLIAVAMWYMAYGCIETNFSRYAVKNLGMDDASKAIPMLVATAAALVCFVPLGILSGKLGRKNTVMLGLGTLTLAALIACFATNIIVLYMLFALIGVSWAAINVNSYPMVVEMAKGGDIGKYTGYYYTFQMAAQIATPLLSGLLIDVVDNYIGKGKGMNILFPYAVLFLLFAAAAMLFVRHGDSKDSDIKPEQSALQSADPVDEINW